MTIRARLILPLMLAAVCTAQETQGNVRRSQRAEPPIVTMSFRGGSLAKFVRAICEAEPKCNIVVAESAADAQLPAMEIKAAGLDQVLESACAVAESKDRIACSESRGNGEPVFAIIARPSGPINAMGPSSRDKISTIVLSLNRLTEGDARYGVKGIPVKTILSAVEAGTSYGNDKDLMMRYHEDSGLVFLRGSTQQLSIANEVLQILERDQKERSKNASMRKRGAGNPGVTSPGKNDR